MQDTREVIKDLLSDATHSSNNLSMFLSCFKFEGDIDEYFKKAINSLNYHVNDMVLHFKVGAGEEYRNISRIMDVMNSFGHTDLYNNLTNQFEIGDRSDYTTLVFASTATDFVIREHNDGFPTTDKRLCSYYTIIPRSKKIPTGRRAVIATQIEGTDKILDDLSMEPVKIWKDIFKRYSNDTR